MAFQFLTRKSNGLKWIVFFQIIHFIRRSIGKKSSNHITLFLNYEGITIHIQIGDFSETFIL